MDPQACRRTATDSLCADLGMTERSLVWSAEVPRNFGFRFSNCARRGGRPAAGAR